MKKKSSIPKEEGIISIVQSPEEGNNKTAKDKKIAKENDEKDKGIISVIQTPEEDQKRKIIGN